MAQVRQDAVQLRIDFLTDESGRFAKTIEDTKKFNKEIRDGQKEVERLEKEIATLEKAGQSNISTELKLAEAQRRVTEAIKGSVTAGNALANLDFRNVAPDTLRQRLRQIDEQLKQIPENLRRASPEAAALVTESNRIAKALDGVRRRAGSIAPALNQARSEQSDFFRETAAFAARAAVIWYALGKVVAAAWTPLKLSSEMEQAQVSFETMLRSAAKARRLVTEIIQLAANTPFETAQLTDYVKRLLAMGIASKDVIATITNLGNIAAGVGAEKLPQLVLAYGQVAAKTKLAGGELKQFTEAGVPLVAALTEQFKVNEAQIFKMVESGKIGFGDVKKAIEGMTNGAGLFSGLMEKQSKTIVGLLSTAKDNFNLTLSAFGDGLSGAVKQILSSFIAFGNGLMSNKETVVALGRAVGTLIGYLIAFLPVMASMAIGYLTYAAAIRVATLNLALDTAATAVATVASTAFRAAKILAAAAVALFSGNVGRASAAMRLFNLTIGISPISLLVGLLSAAVAYFALFGKNLNTVSEAQTKLNETINETSRAVADEIQQSTDLFAILKDETASRELKEKAMKRILELYPKSLGDIKTETGLLANLEIAQKRVNDAILEGAFARIKQQKMSAMTAELIEIEISRAEKQRQLAEEKKRNPSETRTKIVGAAATSMTVADNTAQNLRNELAALDEQAKAKTATMTRYANDVNVAFVNAKNGIGGLNLSASFSKFDAEIDVLSKKLTENPADKNIAERLEKIKKDREAAMKAAIEGDKKGFTEGSAEKAKTAKQIAQSELEQMRAHHQQLTNELTLKRLREGKIESEFEKELAVLRGQNLKEEEYFLAKRKKLLVGEYEKTAAERLKIERKIRELELAERLEAVKLNAEAEQSKNELAFARGEVSQNAHEMRTLDITKQRIAEQLAIEGQSKTALAKLTLEAAQNEKAIAKAILEEKLDGIKTEKTRLLSEKEAQFLEGKNSEKAYQVAVAQINLDANAQELAALEALGKKESDLYRQLSLERLRLKKTLNDVETAATMQMVSQLTDAELQELNEKLQDGIITQKEYNAAVLTEKRQGYIDQLQLLRDSGLLTVEMEADFQGKIRDNERESLKTRLAEEKEFAKQKKQVIQEIGTAGLSLAKDLMQSEIDLLSKTEEDKKKNASRIKGLQRTQVVVDSISEIGKIWLHAMDFGPILGPIYGAALTAFTLVRTEKALSNIDAAKFAQGGATGTSTFAPDETGKRPVGIVHENEYVIPEWMVRVMPSGIAQLESMRLRGYAVGGLTYANTTLTPTAQTYVFGATTQNAARADANGAYLLALVALQEQTIKAIEQNREVKFYRNKLDDANAADERDRAAARWKIG